MHPNHVHNLVAKVLRENKELSWEVIVAAFATKFEQDDPNFDFEQFIRRCLGE